MKRFLTIFVILLIGALLLSGGYFAWKGGSVSPTSAAGENALWISAGMTTAPVAGSAPALEAEYLAAKATSLSLQLTLESAKHAIEDALPMVQEQKDNFDFAEERYNRLMPLVEQGTLDLMTASQIQSAYISARASLSQAKYYLGQAQREYGTPETRTVLVQAAESKVEAARQQVEAQKGVPISAESKGGKIFAFFSASIASQLKPGAPARVTLSGHEFDAIVREVSGEVVSLEPTAPPAAALPAMARCQVVILPK